MTEEEWWISEEVPEALALHLCRQRRLNRTKAGRRKLWLFACGCCRRIWSMFEVEQASAAVVVAAERFADGEAPFAEVQNCDRQLKILNYGREQSVMLAARSLAYTNVFTVATATAEHCATAASRDLAFPNDITSDEITRIWLDEQLQAARLLRCIIGNPFRPVTFDPAWRTSDVVALARGIYADRAFDRMPIMADALQDAGCDNDDILNHCRADAVHARGCWVVDAVLGKG